MFDITVLDLKMSQMSGFDLFVKLRTIDGNIRVCFLTAFEVLDEFKEQFPEMEARHFMRKPIEIGDLARKL